MDTFDIILDMFSKLLDTFGIILDMLYISMNMLDIYWICFVQHSSCFITMQFTSLIHKPY